MFTPELVFHNGLTRARSLKPTFGIVKKTFNEYLLFSIVNKNAN